MNYRMNEISFDLPGEGWEDETINVLRIDAPDDSRVALVVTRGAPVAPDGLAARMEKDRKDEARQLRGYQLLGRASFVAGGVEGSAVRFRWVNEDGAYHNEIAYVPLPERLLVVTVTGKAPQAAACGELLQRVLETLTVA